MQGGEDWASPRYIHTRLSRLAGLLYPREDDAVLEHLEDDGVSIEPRHYLPVLPVALLNGATGIGTGYSTSVPSYDPRAVSAAVRAWLGADEAGRASSESAHDLDRPWHRGFRGAIELHNGKLRSRGIVARHEKDRAKARVTELPLGSWTEDFKAALETLVERNADVRSFTNDSTDATVDFTITFSSAAVADAWLSPAEKDKDAGLTRLEAELGKVMVGNKGLSTTNMHLFNARGQIQKYATPWDVVREFCVSRLDGYVRRRAHVIARLTAEAALLRNKSRFLELVADGRLELHGSHPNLGDDMAALGLERIVSTIGGGGGGGKKKGVVGGGQDDQDDDGGEGEDDGGGGGGDHQQDKKRARVEPDTTTVGFKYLLSMPMASLTPQRKAALDAQLTAKLAEVARVEASTATDLWKADLDAFDVEYRAYAAAVPST